MKIGSDPEVFLVDVTGKYISSIGLIGGTKENPRPIREDGCAVQEDNVAVEFNTPPAETVDAFIEGIKFNLDYLTEFVKQRGLSLSIDASAEFPEDQLADPRAQVFGCDPDFNAWTHKLNPRPTAQNMSLRAAGGHVHAGCKDEDIDPWLMGQAMDLYLGVKSVGMDPDTKRRELYGKAGAVRIKPYGVEYRTLSNFWLKSPELQKWVYTQTLRACDFIKSGGKFSKDEGEKIQWCINNSDVNLMKEIVEEYGL